MLVSYRFLAELIPELNREADEVAEALSAIGLAVDGITDFGAALRPLVLAEVVRVEPHPDRAALQLVTVVTRPEKEPASAPVPSMPPSVLARKSTPALPGELTVVCGAKNVPPPGDLVVLAGLGVKLPGVDFVLTERAIGSVVSHGMLCSESELGLAAESAGILTFPAGSYEPGTRFIDAFPEARDVVFELDVTPNRPDALGHVGVARDLAAFFELDWAVPELPAVVEKGQPTSARVTVENRVPDRAPRYGVALVEGVEVRPSPDFVRWRLHRLGIRPISNVVDVTNWILVEWGQPLHAFDLAEVRGKKIVIRAATVDETMTTLDGQTRKLALDDVVITDAEGPTALAGVMGGKDSEVRPTTRDVLLECAYFAPRGIRRTSRRHGLHTESSHRFERGTDHGATEVVLERARRLLVRFAGGTAAPGTVRADGAEIEIPSIEFRGERMDSLLGVDVPFKEATRILARLGFTIEYVRDTKEGQVALIRGASHRPDVKIEVDLIEEVARMRGLDNVPTVLPAIPPQEPRTSLVLERQAALAGVELGLSEALTYAFVAPGDLAAVHAPASVVTLSNPLTEERSVLRTSLLPGLLEALRRARRRGERRVQLFTQGAVFLPVDTDEPAAEARPRQEADRGHLPIERPSWAAVLAGPRDEHLALRPGEVDFYDAKAIALGFVERLTGRAPTLRRPDDLSVLPHLHPRGACFVEVEGHEVGRMGPLHPDVVERLDLDGTALVVEFDLAALERLGKKTPRFVPIPKLPAITRDLSLVVKDEVPAADVVRAVAEAAGELCESAFVATEFRGGSVPAGHRSLTLRAVYRDPLARTNSDAARTLTDKEVDAAEARALELARTSFGATLRG